MSGRHFVMSPELRSFIDRVIVPALLQRFLREDSAELPKRDATF
jgi:hypothetical protein